MIKTITALQLQHRLTQNEVLLVDVREPAEHMAGAIEGSYLIPLAELTVEKLPATSLPIVFYCRSGARSDAACRIILDQDPALEVYNLEGGIIAWLNCIRQA